MKTTALLAFLLGFLAAPVFAFEAANLVKNGGFKEVYEDGRPADWINISHPNYLATMQTTVTVVPEGQFFRVVRKSNGGVQLGEQRIPLGPDVKEVRIALRIRSSDFKMGDADWQVPGLSYSWILADNTERQIGPGSWLLLRRPVQDWTPLETILPKPENVAGIKIAILGLGWTGQADYDDITVEPL